jgi:hypothetical protein
MGKGGPAMKTPTLVTRRVYFGVDALRLREAATRVLLRLQGLPPERASVGLNTLAHEFGWNTSVSRDLAEEMVNHGMLERRHPGGNDFGITHKFRLCALARIVEPLPRTRAHLLLGHIRDVAEQFNRKASNNKYEIDAIAVFGAYMSLDPLLSELEIAVTGRRRTTFEQPVFGRATKPTEGHVQIGKLLEAQSSFIEVNFFRVLQDVPRPFSVIFRAEA